jgi:TRAP-type C4-dicarboxylate transport system substrate-binding protein
MRHALLGIVAAAALAAFPALAQDKKVELKLAHWLPPKHPLHPAIEGWAKSIETASNGTIRSTIFPAEQLGKAFDHYDMARDGISDASYVNPGYQPGRFPVIAAGELPFLIANAKEGSAAFDEWYRKHAAREMGDVKFCAAFLHDPGSFHARKKIMAPADVKGLKVRPSNGTMAQYMTLLGGANVQASAPEAREMLERGVADAIVFPWGSIVLFGIDKVVKYHMDAPLYVSNFVWVLNKAKYEGMSAAQKQVVDDHCTTEWARKLADRWAEFEDEGRDKLRKSAGHEVYKISADQLAEWRNAAAPLQAKWAENVKAAGGDPEAILADFKAILAKHKAQY